jgi:anti-anti-sigma factor
MNIVVDNRQGRVPVTVFRVKGDIDSTTYEQLEARAREAYSAGTRHLLLDLTDVPYVSSAGIRALNNLFKLLKADTPDESDEAIARGVRAGTFKSPHLKLLNPSPRVKEVLSMAGVDMFLEMHDNFDAALASF